MKKIILSIVAIFMMFLTVNVEAANEKISISDVKVKDKSSTVNIANTNFENNIVSSKVQFNQVNDYILYEFTIDNKDSYDYKIDSITDNNSNSNISIDYDYDKNLKKNSKGTIQIKITYKNKSEETINLNDLQFKISLVNNIIRYVVIFTISLASLLFLKKKSKALLIIPLLVIPYGVYASEKKEIVIKFTNIEVRGFDQEGVPVCTDNETLFSKVTGYEVTDVAACKDFMMSTGLDESGSSTLCNGELLHYYGFEFTISDVVSYMLNDVFTFDQMKSFIKEVKQYSCKSNCGENEYLYESPSYYSITDRDLCIDMVASSFNQDRALELCNSGDEGINYAINNNIIPYYAAKKFVAKIDSDTWCRPISEQSYDIVDIGNGTGIITNYNCTDEECSSDVVIPQTLTGKNGNVNINSIGYRAFINKQLTSVEIPNSITTIGNEAFMMNQLTSLEIPNSVTSIGSDAFANNKLTSVTLPENITAIRSGTFKSNKLTSISIPNKVTTIGDYAFYRNNLISLEIPNSVTNIGEYAFGNNALTSVTLSNNLVIINMGTFDVNELNSIEIPNSVTEIYDYAFDNNNLTYETVTITNSETLIGYRAFGSGYNPPTHQQEI